MDKIKIRMSSLCKDRLESDYQTFFFGEDIPSFNSFVCSLILAMEEKRKADHEAVLSSISDILGGRSGQAKAEEILARLTTVTAETDEMALDEAISLRPNKEQVILFEELSESSSTTSFSAYLRGLLDSYFLLYPCEREKLIHQREYDRIINAIEERRIVRVNRDDSFFEFRPFKVLPNPDRSFLYVVGLKGREGDEVCSIHLFKLHTRLLVLKERFLILKGQTQILQASLSKGAAFLMDNEATATVKLDFHGLNYLKRIYHNRPLYEIEGSDSSGKYTLVKLKGSQRQIEYFVLHLAEHAFVIEPEALRKKIATRLEEGYRHYKNETEKLAKAIDNKGKR